MSTLGPSGPRLAPVPSDTAAPAARSAGAASARARAPRPAGGASLGGSSKRVAARSRPTRTPPAVGGRTSTGTAVCSGSARAQRPQVVASSGVPWQSRRRVRVRRSGEQSAGARRSGERSWREAVRGAERLRQAGSRLGARTWKAMWRIMWMTSLNSTTPAPVATPTAHATSSTAASGSCRSGCAAGSPPARRRPPGQGHARAAGRHRAPRARRASWGAPLR